jgi:hypothetical protein
MALAGEIFILIDSSSFPFSLCQPHPKHSKTQENATHQASLLREDFKKLEG